MQFSQVKDPKVRDQVTYVRVSSKSQVLTFKSFFLGQVKSNQVTGYIYQVESSQVLYQVKSSQVTLLLQFNLQNLILIKWKDKI